MAYREAWALQERLHAEVVGGGEERLLLVEHPPVITFGRRANVERHLIASDEQLARLGVETVQSDRGGDITFHGPGQLVAYPIVRLADHSLLVGSYVRRLVETVIATLNEFEVSARCDPTAVGVWVPVRDGESQSETLAKICAVGVRIRRGVSMHGIALNVTTDLRYFDLIVPCGLVDRAMTSMERALGAAAPSMKSVKQTLIRRFLSAFSPAALASVRPACPQ